MSGAVRTVGTRRWTAPGLCGVHVGRSPLAAPGEQGRDGPMAAPALDQHRGQRRRGQRAWE